MRLLLSVPLVCAALLPPGMAAAQERTILVFFQPSNVPRLNDAIATALSQPPFLFSPKLTPAALVVSIPDKVQETRGKVSGVSWSFTAVFSRNGDTLGQSQEDCSETRASDCIDQLMSDIKTAAGMQ